MPRSEIVLAMLRGYATKAKQTQIRATQFAAFVRQYSETHQDKNASLKDFLTNTEGMLVPTLTQLAEEGKCTLEFEGSEIKTIVFLPLLAEKIEAAYREIDQDADTPFPNEERLQLTAPPSMITVNIKTDFVHWLAAKPKETQILRLSFPEDIVSMLITTDLLERKLLEYSVLKIRNYLAAGSNSGYVLQRLKEIFTLKDQVLQSMMSEIISRPGQVVQNLLNATEFTFAFWAHLASIILKEYKSKTEKLPQEHGYCQAAYLIGLYNVYFKGLLQRDKDVEFALKGVEKRLGEEPFYFTISDIYDFRDDKGVPLTKRCPKERLNEFLEAKTKSPSEALLPEVLRIRAANKKEYFVHKSVVLRLTLNKLFAASREYREYYSKEWFEALGSFEKTPIMLRDDLFLRDLEERLQSEDPLLSALLSFDRLYVVRKERSADEEINRRIDRLLDLKKQELIPLDLILGLKRRDILTEARLKLPLWKTIPVLKYLFRFLDGVIGGRHERAGARAGEGGAVKVLSNEAPRADRRKQHSDEENGDDLFGPYSMPEEAELDGPRHGGEQRNDEKRAPHREGAAPVAGGGRPAAAATAAASENAKARAAAYRKAIAELAVQLIGDAKNIDATLKALAEKWNPLYAEKAKRNLVEDVNSFVRDQVRTLKRSLLRKPPDMERVNNLSQQIAENSVFEQIKRKEEFREYVKLYLIKVLGKV
jgi:hypothetical protein